MVGGGGGGGLQLQMGSPPVLIFLYQAERKSLVPKSFIFIVTDFNI